MNMYGKCLVRYNDSARVVELRHIVRFCKIFDCDFVVISDGNDFLFSIYQAGGDMPQVGTFEYIGEYLFS